METPVAFSDLQAQLLSISAADDLSMTFDRHYLLVDIEGWSDTHRAGVANTSPRQPNCPVIALADDDSNLPPVIDLVANSESELMQLIDAIDNNPVACTILVQLLRHNETASVTDGLFAESLSYSCLQHGQVFNQWLSDRNRVQPQAEDNSKLVLINRIEDQLHITLNRPRKRNAYSAGLRDALYEALVLAAADDSIARVILRGAGENFSAGGDLDEFGMARDGAYAHVARLTRSNGFLLDQLRSKTEFHLHGACIGAGIELPSFSRLVLAAANSFFQLPEVSMGLIPGAGGTVSILRRIGRLRTAYMAISNQRISTEVALAWGLIDEIEPDS